MKQIVKPLPVRNKSSPNICKNSEFSTKSENVAEKQNHTL